MSDRAPSAFSVSRFASEAREKLTELLDEHGVVLDSEVDTLEALAEEGFDARRMLARLGRSTLDADAMVEMITARLDNLEARKVRYERSAQTLRALTRQLMEGLKLPKHDDAEFTARFVKGRASVVIDDVDKVPDQFVDVRTSRVPKKAEIAKAIIAKETVDGAHLSDIPVHFRIESK